MRNRLLLLLFVLISGVASAQGVEKKIGYFSENLIAVTDSAGARYYRTLESTEKCYLVRDYYRSGKIRSWSECSKYDDRPYRNGKSIFYYENGNLEEEGLYENNSPNGEFIYYYDTGKPRERAEHRQYQKSRYLQGYDVAGRELITDGNGVLLDSDEAGDMIYSKVKAYEIISCYKVKSVQDTVFLPILQHAEYPGGMTALMKFVFGKVKYPRTARKAGIEGNVSVSFVVDKNGVLEDFKVIKGISPDCDAECVRVIQRSSPWKPGIRRGKPVKSWMVVPVMLRLRR